jgi:hypothetical protein
MPLDPNVRVQKRQRREFRYYILKQKADVFHAMKSFFRIEQEDKMFAKSKFDRLASLSDSFVQNWEPLS